MHHCALGDAGRIGIAVDGPDLVQQPHVRLDAFVVHGLQPTKELVLAFADTPFSLLQGTVKHISTADGSAGTAEIRALVPCATTGNLQARGPVALYRMPRRWWRCT